MHGQGARLRPLGGYSRGGEPSRGNAGSVKAGLGDDRAGILFGLRFLCSEDRGLGRSDEIARLSGVPFFDGKTKSIGLSRRDSNSTLSPPSRSMRPREPFVFFRQRRCLLAMPCTERLPLGDYKAKRWSYLPVKWQ